MGNANFHKQTLLRVNAPNFFGLESILLDLSHAECKACGEDSSKMTLICVMSVQ